MKNKKITLEDLANSIGEVKNQLNGLDTTVNDLAISTKKGFDSVDFKFDIVNDRFRDVDVRFDRMEKKFDLLRDDVVKTNDAFGLLSNYVNCEIAAVRSHMMRVDEKIGLANA